MAVLRSLSFLSFLELLFQQSLGTLILANSDPRIRQAADRPRPVFLIERMSSSVQVVHVLEIVWRTVGRNRLEKIETDADVRPLIIFLLVVLLVEHLIALDPQSSERMQFLRVFD
jgi:hypothetical protein